MKFDKTLKLTRNGSEEGNFAGDPLSLNGGGVSSILQPAGGENHFRDKWNASFNPIPVQVLPFAPYLPPINWSTSTKAIICVSLILRRFTKYYNVQLSVPGRFHSEEFNADIISSHPTLLLPWAPLGVCACRSLVAVVVVLVLFSFARM